MIVKLLQRERVSMLMKVMLLPPNSSARLLLRGNSIVLNINSNNYTHWHSQFHLHTRPLLPLNAHPGRRP
jgi:hypothetical protein